MPDLRIPDLSRHTTVATVLVMVGVVAMLVAAFSSSSSSNSDNPRQNRNGTAVRPVPPIDPADIEQGPNATARPPNPTDPFAVSFGASARRKVTVRVTANGLVNLSLTYRGDKKPLQRTVNGSFSASRTFKSRYPMASVVLQIPGAPNSDVTIPGVASRATCILSIDGLQVSKQTTSTPGGLTFCVG